MKERLVIPPAIDVDSYQQYLKSRYHMLKMSKPDIMAGLDLLQKVIEINPGFALAYLGMHHGYAMLATLGLLPAAEAFMKGKVFLDKAIELDPALPECRMHLAWMSFLRDWDPEGAYRHLNHAFEIRPTVDYYQSMASILVAEKKFKEALDHISRAKELDPFSEINYHLHGFILYCQEHYAEAIELFGQNVALKPDSQVSLLNWGQALLLQGKAKEALEFFQNLPAGTDHLLRSGGMTLAYIALGNMDAAASGMSELTTALQSESMDRALNLLIYCHTSSGNHAEALQLIEQGISNHLPMMLYLPVEPILKPLYGYEKFRTLMSKVLK